MRVKIGDREVEGKQISFSAISEPWAEYQLEDGSTCRLKVVLTKAISTEEKNPDGTRIYQMQAQTLTVVDEKS
jgi:hypothetical protein